MTPKAVIFDCDGVLVDSEGIAFDLLTADLHAHGLTMQRPALERALWLESDRMGYLLGAVTQGKLDNQRGVVQNEKREGDNEPGGLVFDDFIKAVLIGNLLLGIYTACLGYIGASTGLSTHLLARYSFGVKGSWLPSLLLGGTQVGWFGVGVAMFALPVQKATGIDVNWLIAISGILPTCVTP